MSVLVSVSCEIHDFDPSRGGDLREAAHRFLIDEQLLGDPDYPDMFVELRADEGVVRGFTPEPLIISSPGYDRWVNELIPAVTERWKRMAAEVNGGPCRADVTLDWPDL